MTTPIQPVAIVEESLVIIKLGRDEIIQLMNADTRVKVAPLWISHWHRRIDGIRLGGDGDR
jgi:hypothetical protein